MNRKDLIKEGDHIVLKRDEYFWAIQVRANRFVYVDKHKFKLDGVINEPYGSKFQLKNDSISRLDSSTVTKLDIPDCGKGVDNRNIVGKDTNQQLSHEEILAMKKDGITGDSIVGRLIENSSTFSLKTEYAQDKYIAKKKRKHMPVFIILRPTTRLLVEMYFAKSPGKICHLRPDTLGQILTRANVRAHSNVAVVDTCLGLIVGSVMERLGGYGNIIHVYHGQYPMRPAVEFYDFDQSHMDTLHSFPMEKLNLFKKTGNILIEDDKSHTENSLLENCCKKIAKIDDDADKGSDTEKKEVFADVGACNKEFGSTSKSLNGMDSGEKIDGQQASSSLERVRDNKDSNGDVDTSNSNSNREKLTTKNIATKIEDKKDPNEKTDKTDIPVCLTIEDQLIPNPEDKTQEQCPDTDDQAKPHAENKEQGPKAEKKRFRKSFEDREAKREVELKKLASAQEILINKKLDCIIVASKFYPTPLVLNLIRYLAPSRQLVVYSQYKEPLMECYAQLREVGGLVNFRVMETWLREFQVLNMRTHPLVNMSGTGGYILVATSVTKV